MSDTSDEPRQVGDNASADTPGEPSPDGKSGGSVARRAPSLTNRIFLALLIVSIVAVVLATVANTIVYQNSVMDDAREQLAREADVLSQAIEQAADDQSESAVLSRIDLGNLRATLIDPSGEVLFDSESDAATMPNHLDRPEVAEALSTGEGSVVRSSSTLGNVSLYQAVRLQSGNVLRISIDRAGVSAMLYRDLGVIIAVMVLLAVVAWIVARVLSKRLVRPIINMYPFVDGSSDMRTASERAASGSPCGASSVTRPTVGAVASDDECVLMQPAVSPYRELDPLTQRINSQHARLVRQMNQLRDADLMRSEFTANVTHELKTPLQSISGASELMCEGLVQPDDVPDFARRIYNEARRLTNLVNDILMLSKLDDIERGGMDGTRANCEPVDLFAVAHDVEQRLAVKADDAEVELTLDGGHAMVFGLPRLVDELISNLVDNAIRYNHPGGYVRVWVGQVAGRPTVRVSDTGIGISSADQDKVFERFYRVEKSRSRASGGTGLGLAIVKHAAAFHHASVDIISQLGKGSTFTVTFPPR